MVAVETLLEAEFSASAGMPPPSWIKARMRICGLARGKHGWSEWDFRSLTTLWWV